MKRLPLLLQIADVGVAIKVVQEILELGGLRLFDVGLFFSFPLHGFELPFKLPVFTYMDFVQICFFLSFSWVLVLYLCLRDVVCRAIVRHKCCWLQRGHYSFVIVVGAWLSPITYYIWLWLRIENLELWVGILLIRIPLIEFVGYYEFCLGLGQL